MFGLFGGDKKTDTKKKTAQKVVPAPMVEKPVAAPTPMPAKVEAVKPVETVQPAAADPAGNMLMISTQRHRSFYERAARELLASGYETLHLSALGNAVPIAVQVALTLQGKNAATLKKIETKFVDFSQNDKGRTNDRVSHASGVSIILARHPEFRGTRIIPGHVFFCGASVDADTLAFPKQPDVMFACVNYGTSKVPFLPSAEGAAMKATLAAAGQDVSTYSTLHQHLFQEAAAANVGIDDLKAMKFVGELSAIKTQSKDLKAGFVRYCPTCKPTDMAGCVFIQLFNDECCPHNNTSNAAVIHLAAPSGADYASPSSFLAAVEIAATNLMTALCDFNGYARRHTGEPKLRKIFVARMGLFSADSDMIHPKTTKVEVAKAMIAGLNNGYHFGTSPRIQFVDDAEGTLKTVWMDATGSDASQLQVTEDSFRPRRDQSLSPRRTG